MKNQSSLPPVLQIQDLSFTYDKELVLSHLSFTVPAGAFFGLVGPNGSGKSTLIELILGLLPSNERGKIKVFGISVPSFTEWSRIGYISQKATSFNQDFPVTVFEVVSMGLVGKRGLFKPIRHKDKMRVKEALHEVGMASFSGRKMSQLSGGQQQRVFIARALVSQPEFLILDEPTVGIDEDSVASFYRLLQQLNDDHGMTLLIVAHDRHVMNTYATHVFSLGKGYEQKLDVNSHSDRASHVKGGREGD
ncbi:ABC transporter ATP-binding protein [Bacillaceae bacterium SIJ1]|uniref:metal ABC transporter ATP-binding protein n=1 Tax=Litoribacterium kuwaitense TaxID=1398745 RepID=UPI0013ED3BE2|nr:ABC transporter ATP-binding protein [Litoribacterium kuwaitense]NGP43542.1 ABC transporter ATP-binding protein [Litoribacterium kuwaitense]